jgi:phytoene/squalene synthetase
MIYDWWDAVITRDSSDPFVNDFLEVIERFKIPKWPWERFLEAMVYDLEHDGFHDFRTFLRYSEGAAIAPASIFMHLCGVRRIDGEYQPPDYDIRKAARYLALFSYLVHILRDFEKDQKENLNYFAEDQLRQFKLSRNDLFQAALSGQLNQNVRALIYKYKQYAEHFRRKARWMMDRIIPCLEDRYQLSYEIIYSLYLQIYEMVDPDEGSLAAQSVNPDESAIHERINQTISNFRPV